MTGPLVFRVEVPMINDRKEKYLAVESQTRHFTVQIPAINNLEVPPPSGTPKEQSVGRLPTSQGRSLALCLKNINGLSRLKMRIVHSEVSEDMRQLEFSADIDPDASWDTTEQLVARHIAQHLGHRDIIVLEHFYKQYYRVMRNRKLTIIPVN